MEQIIKMLKAFRDVSKKQKAVYTREEAANFAAMHDAVVSGNWDDVKPQLAKLFDDLMRGAEGQGAESCGRYKAYRTLLGV